MRNHESAPQNHAAAPEIASKHQEHQPRTAHTTEAPSHIERALENSDQERRTQEARTEIDIQALPKAEHHPVAHSASAERAPHAGHTYRAFSYKSALKRVQKRLPSTDRALSKVIHAPGIDTVSETISTTIARPSALIGGGATALIGVTAFYLVAKYYGFELNNLVLFILYLCGMLAGLLIEFIIRKIKRD